VILRVKVCKFIWQHVSVRKNIEVQLPKLVLHLDHIVTKPVLSCQLVTHWKMVDLLILIQAFIQIGLAGLTCPQDIPVMSISMHEIVGFEHRADQFDVRLEHLVHELVGLTIC